MTLQTLLFHADEISALRCVSDLMERSHPMTSKPYLGLIWHPSPHTDLRALAHLLCCITLAQCTADLILNPKI